MAETSATLSEVTESKDRERWGEAGAAGASGQGKRDVGWGSFHCCHVWASLLQLSCA